MELFMNFPLIICTLYLFINPGLTAETSRRSWTTDGKRYFNKMSFVFASMLIDLISSCVDCGRAVMVLFLGGTEGLGRGGSEL